jgi:hypothetical protein
VASRLSLAVGAPAQLRVRLVDEPQHVHSERGVACLPEPGYCSGADGKQLSRRAEALEAGGYGVGPAYPMLPPEVGAYVVWHAADELASEAFEHLEASDLEHASVLHLGRVLEAMAEVLLQILRSRRA